jgi:hypothetical protein
VVQQYPSLAAKAMFVQLLSEGSSISVPASQNNLDLWVSSLGVQFTAVHDVAGAGQAMKTTFGARMTTYIVERATGKIVVKKSEELSALEALKTLP